MLATLLHLSGKKISQNLLLRDYSARTRGTTGSAFSFSMYTYFPTLRLSLSRSLAASINISITAGSLAPGGPPCSRVLTNVRDTHDNYADTSYSCSGYTTTHCAHTYVHTRRSYLGNSRSGSTLDESSYRSTERRRWPNYDNNVTFRSRPHCASSSRIALEAYFFRCRIFLP